MINLSANVLLTSCQSQWPRGLRRRSAAARLLRLWARIPPGHGCLSVVSVVCRQVEVSATGRSLDQRSHTECGVSGCDREVLIMTRPWPTGGCCDMIKKDKPMVNQTHNIYPSARPSTQIIVYSMQFCFVLAHESFSASQDVFCFLGT